MGNPLLGSLTDPFTAATLNTTVWNASSGSVTTVPALGMAQVPCPTVSGTSITLGAAGPYDATGQALYAQVTPVLRGNGGTKTLLKIFPDANNSASIRIESGVFMLKMQAAGVFTQTNLPAYDPTQHAWWRLREQSGTWYAETSPDGYAWTTQASSSYSWSPTAVQVVLQTAASDTEPSGLFAGFQHVNTMLGPSGLMPSWPKIRFGVAFNTGGTSTTLPAFVDLSSRLRGSWSADLAGRQYELDQIQSGQLSLTLWNLDGALDPLNTSSPYSPNVLPMRQCSLQAVWPPSRNMLPQNVSSAAPSVLGPATMGMGNTVGSLAAATGLPPAPTGHTTAFAWTIPASATTANAVGLAAANNNGAGWPVSDSSSLPVVAGQSYTFTCYVAQASGGDATLQAAHRISWYDQTGVRITASVGTGVVAPVLGTTWAQLTYTVTAPATAVCARTAVENATVPSAATTLYVTAWQMEQASVATPWTPGGVIFPLWTGYVERWPQQWNYSGTYGLVDLTCVDVMAGLAQFTLQQSLTANLMAMGPDRLYPLDEPSGSTAWRDASGKHGWATTGKSFYGAGTITSGNSVTGTGFVGASGPVVTIANPTPTNNTNSAGSFINLGTPNGPPTGGGWTRIICFRTSTVPPSGTEMALWWWQASATSNQSQGGLSIDSNGHVNASTNNSSGAGLNASVPTINVCDGNWHMAAIILTADGKTLNVNVDGVGYQLSGSTNCQPSGINCDTIGINATPAVLSYTWPYSGDIAYAVEIPTNNVPSFSDLAGGFSTGWAGETSAARAQRILTMAGYGGTISTQGAALAMGGANLAGTDPMSALTLVGDTEAGQVYVDASGVLWLTGRLWRYLQSNPTVTFGENQAAGEVPYLGDLAVDFDTTHIYNAAQITQVVPPGATQPPMQPANNTTSQQQYLPRTIQRSINTQDQTLALAAGQYLVSQYGQPLARLAALNIDVASNPALLSTALALAFGARAQVNRRPPSGPGATQLSIQAFVEHLSWAGDDQGNLKLALQLTPAAPYLGWWVVAAMHTTVATASTAGTATVTLAALTGAALNPAAAVLAPGTQLTLGYGTANAETLTVQSVAATSPGYTSVAVTFTANTAHNHAVGDVVCEPLPGGYQLPAATAAGYPASLDAGATLSTTSPRAAY